MKYQYNEMRPVLHAINQLMQRVDAANLRENSLWRMPLMNCVYADCRRTGTNSSAKQIDDRRSATKSTADMEISLDRAVSLSRQLGLIWPGWKRKIIR